MLSDCPAEEILGAWLEGGLTGSEKDSIARHLLLCDLCRKSIALTHISTLNPEAALAVERSVRTVSSHRQIPLLVRRAGLVAAVLLMGIALAFWTWPRPAPAPTEPPPPMATSRPPPLEPPPPETPHPENPVSERTVTHAPEASPAPERPVPLNTPPLEAPHPEPPALAPSELITPPPPKIIPPIPEKSSETKIVHVSVLLTDISGALRLQRGEHTRWDGARSYETVSFEDRLKTDLHPASFTLNGEDIVVLDRDTEISLARLSAGYVLSLDRGLVYVESKSDWEFSSQGQTLSMTKMNGCVAFEKRRQSIHGFVIKGSYGSIAEGWSIEPGPKRVEASELRRHRERFDRARPKEQTLFWATFDEEAPPYRITGGVTRQAKESQLGYILAANVVGELIPGKAGPVEMGASVKFPREIPFTRGFTLRFGYRTRASRLAVSLKRFTTELSSVSKGKWTQAEIPVAQFEEEGIPIVPGDRFDEATFAVPSNENGFLEIDSIQIVRRF